MRFNFPGFVFQSTISKEKSNSLYSYLYICTYPLSMFMLFASTIFLSSFLSIISFRQNCLFYPHTALNGVSMKGILIATLFFLCAASSKIQSLINQVNEDGPNVHLSDPLPITEGLDLSICFRFSLNHLLEEKIFLMNFDYDSSLNYISTYLLWTLDGSKVQLFQRSNVKQLRMTLWYPNIQDSSPSTSSRRNQVIWTRYRKYLPLRASSRLQDFLTPHHWHSLCFIFDQSTRRGKVFLENQLMLVDTLRWIH